MHVPCVSDLFVVECDASSTGVGAVLVWREGELKPVAFIFQTAQGRPNEIQHRAVGSGAAGEATAAPLLITIFGKGCFPTKPGFCFKAF